MPEARSKRGRLTAAFTEMLAVLGAERDPEMRHTAERAASLWLDHLVAGQGRDLGRILGRGAPSASHSPVSLFDIGVHLVCPHHLTVAFGQAHVAYIPNGRVVGFGALARLVAAATARLSLQEDATDCIAATLVEHLGAAAAVAVIVAVHPCHNVIHPRSHQARAATWAVHGDPVVARTLKADLRQALALIGAPPAAVSARRSPRRGSR